MPNKDKKKTELVPKIKKYWLVIASSVVLILAFLGLTIMSNNTASQCAGYRNDKIIKANGYKIKVEVAGSATEREKGLSGRTCIDANQGMLFVFDHPGTYAIWMKDMKFPIDIIWIGSEHKIVGIEKNVDPSTYPDRFTNKDKQAQYVLELQANRVDSLKLNLNDQISF